MTPAPSEMLPTISATATIASSRASVQRGRGRIRAEDARAGRSAGRAEPAPHRSRGARPLEAKPDLADRDLVAEPERRDGRDRAAVDERAVRAAEVLDVPAPAAVGQHRVLGRGERVLDDDRVVDVATERRDRVEVERPSRSPGRRRATRRRPGGRATCRARARRRAGRAAASGRRGEERGRAEPGTAAGRPRP